MEKWKNGGGGREKECEGRGSLTARAVSVRNCGNNPEDCSTTDRRVVSQSSGYSLVAVSKQINEKQLLLEYPY